MYNPHVANLNRELQRAVHTFHSAEDRADWFEVKAHEYAALADGLEASLTVARRRADRAETDLRQAAKAVA